MTKFRVKKNRQITYPDGSLRGERGYVIDDTDRSERELITANPDVFERVERQTPVSPVDPARMVTEAAVEKTAKKKASKKKASKKKASKE